MDFPLKYKELWSKWDVRVLILPSLSIQIILIFLGRMRRVYTSRWIKFIVWGSYLLADWVADFVLGKLSGNMDDSSSSIIIAFWAPFLILHLGGPDTITAYSIEDNELWARHLLGLIYEVSIAFYVLFRSLPNTHLLAPTLMIFFVAIIKYAERTYSLYKASSEGFRNSIWSFYRMLPKNDLNYLNKAFWLYSTTKPSFIDAIPSFVYENVKDLIKNKTPEEVMRIMSMELNYAYDEFYSKAIINHSRIGYVLRVICSFFILLAFLLFLLVPKNDFKKGDIAITYVLLIASICLDVIATIMFVFSDRMVISLLDIKKLSNLSGLLAKYIFEIKSVCYKRSYWPKKLPQMNLLVNCLKICEPKKPPREKIMNWFEKKLGLVQETKFPLNWFLNTIETYTLQTTKPVEITKENLEIVTLCLQRRSDISEKELIELAGLSAFRKVIAISDWAIPIFIDLFEGIQLNHQVVLWHIVTDLCFHWNPEFQHLLHSPQIEMKIENNISVSKKKSLEMKTCMYLSNYMMYMAMMNSDTMPSLGGTRSYIIRKTMRDMVDFFRESGNRDHNFFMQNAKVEKVCVEMMATPIKWAHDFTLFPVAQVVARLMLLMKEEERWKVMNTVWAELLIKGVKNSRANLHMKQLCKGDELLSFIWLFDIHVDMADGLFPIDDISSGYLDLAKDLLFEIEHHHNYL